MADTLKIRKLAIDVDGILHVPMGTTLPSTGTVAEQLFLKTDTGVLYRRNAANDAWVILGVGDHGQLDGLSDDDHTIYTKADGTRAFSGDQSMGSNKLTNLATPTARTDAATKEYVDDGKTWKDQILSVENDPPGIPTAEDRYIVGAVPTGAWVGHENKIAEWNGTAWYYETPEAGWTLYNVATTKFMIYSGSAWGTWDAATDHGALSGLGDDDHTQYQLRSEVKAGNVAFGSFAGTPKKSTVSFNTAMSSTSYAIAIVGGDARIWTIESKTVNGFTINSNSDTALTTSTEWTAILHQNPS